MSRKRAIKRRFAPAHCSTKERDGLVERTIKKSIVFLVLVSLVFCCGCTKAEEKDQPLWVLVDYRTNLPAKQALQSFQQAHPDVSLRVEYLPGDPEEQDLYLEQLRTKIMAGQGPDVFLLTQYSPVFSDVEQSMRNGLFLDISPYYDEDEALQKDSFEQTVMEAGVVAGKRYILPLYYNFPVLYVDTQRLASAGISLDTLGNGLSGLSEVVPKLGKKAVVSQAMLLDYYLPSIFSELIDYQTQEVTWSKEELTAFLTHYRELMTYIDEEYIPWYTAAMINYISNNDFLGQNGSCVYLGTLYSLVDAVRTAKATGTESAIIPVTAADASLCATVTNYGAIGAGTDKPELAYEFLRILALKKSQWAVSNESHSLQGESWPVLVHDSWVALDDKIWESTMISTKTHATEDGRLRRSALAQTAVTAEDYAILNTEISKAYLPLACADEFMMTIRQQLNPYLNPDAASVDVEALADQLIQQLQWLVAEG